jgi:beta-phosphoglucomutase
MLKAILFDFNGIILDDEPIHFMAMRDTVAAMGIHLSREEYWGKYLPLDDATCLTNICRDYSIHLSARDREQALLRKAQTYRQLIHGKLPLFPGAAAFVRAAAERYPLAVASGARRDEIESTLQATGLISCFQVIVAAEDFRLGKPHPESYLLALERLNEKLDGQSARIHPPECLVIEDSIGGVQGARAAGMMCLAVSNTYPSHSLKSATKVVSSLEGVALGELEGLCNEEAF